MVKEVEDFFSDNLAQVKTELEKIEGSVTELKGKVKELVDKRDLSRTGGVSRAAKKYRNCY